VLAAAVLVVAVCAQNGRFKDKKVLVTGGSSGIGYQTALQFAQEGADVIISARDSNVKHHSCKAAAEQIKNITGGSCRCVKADLTKKDDVKNLFDDINKTDHRLDIAVNAAGISGPMGHLLETAQYSAYDPILNNVYSMMRCAAEEERLMVEKNISGVIINLAATEGVTQSSMLPRFAASKLAIIGLSNSLALAHITGEDSPYIRVISVAPGPTATPFLFNKAKFYSTNQQPWEGGDVTEDSKIWVDSKGNFTAHVPMQRIARPKEIANTILWLCTDEAVHISGTTVIADGGLWAV